MGGVTMCVHVLCGCALPDNTGVWVDPTGEHNFVYVDPSLCDERGSLTAAGVALVNAHLRRTPGLPSLDTALPCS